MDEYRFQISPLEVDDILPQVSQALAKRGKLLANKQRPPLWMSGTSEQGRFNSKTAGYLCMALGALLMINGFSDPKENIVKLLFGVIGISMGLTRLRGLNKKKKTPYDKISRELLSGRDTITPGEHQVSFSAKGMYIKDLSKNKHERIPYRNFGGIVEGEDILLATFDRRAAVLLKSDLLDGTLEEFRSFLSEVASA